MRLLTLVLTSASVLGLAACGGGSVPNKCYPGDNQCGKLRVDFFLQAQGGLWQTPDAPIPIGSSVDITFQEQRCVGSGQQGTPPPGVGCGVWYVPATLASHVVPLSNTNTPCPVTVTQRATGTLRFTRTGPGDPIFGAGKAGVNGYCRIEVTDPATNSVPYNVIL
jgi:hypothetical protein